jgi:hypothetical protein
MLAPILICRHHRARPASGRLRLSPLQKANRAADRETNWPTGWSTLTIESEKLLLLDGDVNA